MTMPLPVRFVIAVLISVLAACTGSQSAPRTPVAAPPPIPAAGPTTAAPAVASAAASPEPTAETNGKECADADCEIEVRTGDRIRLDEGFGVRQFTVESLDRDEVVITMLGFSGGLSVEGMSVSVTSTCVNGRCRDEGEVSLRPDAPARIDGVRLKLISLAGDRAVIRLTPS